MFVTSQMESYSPKLLFESSFKSHSTLSVAVVTYYTRIMVTNFIIANHFLQVSQSELCSYISTQQNLIQCLDPQTQSQTQTYQTPPADQKTVAASALLLKAFCSVATSFDSPANFSSWVDASPEEAKRLSARLDSGTVFVR